MKKAGRSRASPYYLISAGEQSGDLLAAELVGQLSRKLPGFSARGIVGPHMAAAGVEAIHDQTELAVIGFVEVLRHLTHIKEIESNILSTVDRDPPAFAVLVDYPGFHLRLAECLSLRGIPVFQYVAPQLWAWAQGRADKLKQYYRLILGIVPFEEAFFRARDVPYRYVGSPVADRVLRAHRRHVVSEHGESIGFFPGSRFGEWERLSQDFLAIKRELAAKDSHKTFHWSIADNLSEDVLRQKFPAVFAEPGLHLVRGQSLDLMGAVDFAVVASGTATLECALIGTPLCVVYRVHPLTYRLARRLVKVPTIGLANLVAGRKVFQEFIQDFQPSQVANAVEQGLREPTDLRTGIKEIQRRMHGNAAAHAAEAIVQNLSAPAWESISD